MFIDLNCVRFCRFGSTCRVDLSGLCQRVVEVAAWNVVNLDRFQDASMNMVSPASAQLFGLGVRRASRAGFRHA